MPALHTFPAPPLPRTVLSRSDQSTPKKPNTYSRQPNRTSSPQPYMGDHRQSTSGMVTSPSSSSSRHEVSRQARQSSTLSSAGESPVRHRDVVNVDVDDDDENGEGDMDVEEDEEIEDVGSLRAGPTGGDEPDEGCMSEWSDDEIEGSVKPILHVECRLTPLKPGGPRPHLHNHLSQNIIAYIQQIESPLLIDTDLDLEEWGNEAIMRNVEKVFYSETIPAAETFDPQNVDIRCHFYRPSIMVDLEEFTAVADEDDEDDAVPAASVRELPSMELEGIWENLIYSTDLKPRLLNYITSTMDFSGAGIDTNKVSWNRLVLLHGPPGTGKTSLCRALAQKLLVRLGPIYSSGGKLVEINSHSLFSKWFSESGKLVQKLFSNVAKMVEDENMLVIVMIDEVESLTAARSAAINGSEPSDALRVVNALLTQLDKLKTCPNVLVLTTSNLPDSIDSAFIDRADEKFFVDYPPPEAVYWILKGCIEELGRKGLMRPCGIPPVEIAKALKDRSKYKLISNGGSKSESITVGDEKRRLSRGERGDEAGMKLWKIAIKCHEHTLAGRFLRRLPLLAHSHYLNASTKRDDDGRPKPRTIEKWLDAFEKVVEDEIRDRARIATKTNTTMVKTEKES